MNKFSILKYDQIYGENELNIIKKYGDKCDMTDLSALLGCRGCYLVPDESYFDFDVLDGIRPSISYSSIFGSASKLYKGKNNTVEVQYGEYPQMLVDDKLSKILEKNYQNKILESSGKVYTFNNQVYEIYKKHLRWSSDYLSILGDNFPKLCDEYWYKNEKYIRFVIGDTVEQQHLFKKNDIFRLADYEGYKENHGANVFLSNGERPLVHKAYWLKVEPIVWLVDLDSDIALSKKILFAGVFETTIDNDKELMNYLNTIFSKEIMSDNVNVDDNDFVENKILNCLSNKISKRELIILKFMLENCNNETIDLMMMKIKGEFPDVTNEEISKCMIYYLQIKSENLNILFDSNNEHKQSL